jgi:uncharacterized protein YjiS (DUF1127 family)
MTNIRWTDQSPPATFIRKGVISSPPASNDDGRLMAMDLFVPHGRGKSTLTSATWIASLWRLTSWPARVINARDLIKTLGGMRNRELADIRLSRGDIRDATAAPSGDDRSELLRARVAERRGFLIERLEKRRYDSTFPTSPPSRIRSRHLHPLLRLTDDS